MTRVCFALEGSQPVQLGESAVLTPSLELCVRHDGGDAGTGFGVDIGAGLALFEPARGISTELRARCLLTHEVEGMRERRLPGTLAFDPASDTERRLCFSEPTCTATGCGSGSHGQILTHRKMVLTIRRCHR